MKIKTCLSGNALKLLAALFMLTDHVGLIFFPSALWLRAIGRLAFPIFAFFIAEGCRYTRSRVRYFATVSAFAAICQAVYYFVTKSSNASVFVTFAISIVFVYTVYSIKDMIFAEAPTRVELFGMIGLILASCAIIVFVACVRVDLDYGLEGAALPVFAAVAHTPRNAPQYWSKIDTPPTVLALFSLGMLAIALVNRPIQYFSFLALPLLLLYTGKRGRLGMKYFFYLFYPLHLALLWGIYYLTSI